MIIFPINLQKINVWSTPYIYWLYGETITEQENERTEFSFWSPWPAHLVRQAMPNFLPVTAHTVTCSSSSSSDSRPSIIIDKIIIIIYCFKQEYSLTNTNYIQTKD